MFDELENTVIGVAKHLAKTDHEQKQKWSNTVWTEQLIFHLGNLGHDRGFYVCGGGCARFDKCGQGEWLYDLVWLKLQNGYQGELVDVPMILESEWDEKIEGVEEDFYKLLVGRAQHRVMIFQQKNAEILTRISRRLKELVVKFSYTQPGDRYLLLGLSWLTKLSWQTYLLSRHLVTGLRY
jgi:hypothetical protein